MLRLLRTNALRGTITSAAQFRRAPLTIVRIGGKNMDAPLVQHSLRQVLRSSTESPGERTRRDLHPHPGLHQPLNRAIARRHPAQPLWVREDGHKPCHKQAEKKLFEMWRFGMMWRLDQNVPRIAEGQQPPALQPCHEVGHHVIVRTANQAQRYLSLIELPLQRVHRLPDLRTVVVIQPRQDMRRTG